MVTDFLDTNKTFLLFALSIVALLFFIYNFQKKKKKLPKEVVSIMNNNFYSALTIVEKELIEELYNHLLKGEEVSTKLINKIIGVQQKDTLTQNKSRSDYFIRINQKFKMATQYSEPLIVKQRDHSDKRQYNYSLNKAYIVDIEKLFKE
jgi:preprotein translocase subunit YajC